MAKKQAVTSNKIALRNVRLSFPSLDKATYFSATPKEDEVPKFKAAFLLDPTNAEHKATIDLIKSEANRILIEAYGDAASIPKKSLERCFGTDDDLDTVYDGYDGMFWIRGSNESRIPIVGRRKNAEGKFTQLQPGDPEFPYKGCYVNAKITLWVQNGSHGRHAVNGNVLTIQYAKPGEAFGRPAADPDAEFEALEDSDDNDSSFLD